MAIRRFEYTPTPTDERSVTEQSWKTISQVKVAEKKGEGGIDRKPTLIERWTQPSALGLSDPVNWKPLSMTAPILSAIIIITLLMIVGIELLAQKSAQQGGLALSPSLDEIPQWARISSEYVPQVLAVAYSLVWSWVDLDVKRMQPWFEMSKPEGALAKDSLLLDYPFTFVAFVPFVAAKRKHWLVFLSGTAMVLIFWAITPLQSAQLGTNEVKLTETRDLDARAQLLPIAEQRDVLDSKILHTGYAIAWLEQQYPPFMTPTEAFLPFYATKNSPVQPGASWTAETTRLTTELDCWPAEIMRNTFSGGETSNTHDFLNGQGYIDPFSKDTGPYNITGLFCQTSYFKQQVLLTVDANTHKPVENTVETIGAKEILSGNEFNTDVLRDSPQMVNLLCSADNGDNGSLAQVLGNRRFRLAWNEAAETSEIRVSSEGEILVAKAEQKVGDVSYPPVKPSALKLESGFAFVVAVLGMLGGLSYLKWAEMKFNVFLANILTISLPAVFQDQSVMAHHPEVFYATMAPVYDNDAASNFRLSLVNFTVTSFYHDHMVSALANLSSGTPLPPWVTHDYFFQSWEIDKNAKQMGTGVYSFRTRGFGIESNCTSIASHAFPLLPEYKFPDKSAHTECPDTLAVARSKMRYSESTLSRGASAGEFSGTGTDVINMGAHLECDKSLILGWARTNKTADINGTIDGSFAICQPFLQTAVFDIEVDQEGYVQGYKAVEDADDVSTALETLDDSAGLLANVNLILGQGPGGWHNDTLTRDWISHLMTVKSGSRAFLDAEEPVPDPDEMIEVFDPIFRSLVALLIAFNRSFLFPAPNASDKVDGHRRLPETRLFMEQGAFVTSMVLLGVNMAIAVAVYTRGSAPALPRLPTTIGSIAAYIAPSRQLTEKSHDSTADTAASTYSFGRFVGHDGSLHVGIEMDPYVVPIVQSSPGKHARKGCGLFSANVAR
ncbi:Protein of unknown function (DUF3433) [Emericellopsis cladophorae]|uniref:Uncharacterized protein n=1 Tax=Emericellopsis cladophorae TaxID=2686198 RepID=A0A9Q0BE06_9HYPO|nr:Protein of unknown function (DUF3433) [Emericellopsis cladophorae]KAI6782432.1 Protein of unknown function (DUF3433) [Emericellopsis cladophorae]